jgi:hypothetical protein
LPGGVKLHNAVLAFGKTVQSLENPIAWAFGVGIGIFTYLIGEPGTAFYALWIAVAMDLISRLMSESYQHGGFWKAIKEGHIQSDKALSGAKMKIPAYFIMCIFAAQITKFPYEYAYVGSSVIYGIFFFVELESTCENFIEAGIEEFNWLKRFSKRKLEQIVEDGGESNENKDSEYPI